MRLDSPALDRPPAGGPVEAGCRSLGQEQPAIEKSRVLHRCIRDRSKVMRARALLMRTRVRRERNRALYEKTRAQRRRLISVRRDARQAYYGRLHVVAELPADPLRFGDPDGDIPVDAVYRTGPSGVEGTELDGAARPGAVWNAAHQAFFDQTMSDAVNSLFSISLLASSALSSSSEAPVRQRLQRLISEADTTIRTLGRAQLFLGEAGRGAAEPPGQPA